MDYLAEIIFFHPMQSIGKFVIFVATGIRRGLSPFVDIHLLAVQMQFVGNKSLGIIALAGIMVGGIFGLLMGDLFRIFSMESMIGAAATIALTREMAPVIGSMLVTGRAGSAMAAELATMRVNEQIDAMRVMSINPYAYLIAPRLFASMIMMPILTIFFVLTGVFSSFFMGIFFYDVDVGIFFERIDKMVSHVDLLQGLQKSVIFGLILAGFGCYKGFNAIGGAKGVGKATTEAVVASLLSILIADFFLSYLQFKFGGLKTL